MKVALVHDYLREFGGAERVLRVLSDMYPEAPIYTAFYDKNSEAYKRFSDREIVPSWAQRIPGFVSKLHSPLRFLAPHIWESFNLDSFDMVISSASWYITKGILTRPETVHICYCHTPPRYLYGYDTSVYWQKHWPVRMYATLVNKGLREYDYLAAQRVDQFVVNSTHVAARVKKYYGRESVVIYPPVRVDLFGDKAVAKDDYILTGGRLVGGKNFELIVQAGKQAGVRLKIFGQGRLGRTLQSLGGDEVELVGELTDIELVKLYSRARAFVVMAQDEDYGITPVEAMAAGTPVLAYRGGGYMETVTEGKTGMFVDELTVGAVARGIQSILTRRFNTKELRRQARKFEDGQFRLKMKWLVDDLYSANQD
jgi:glycosyltransferase involved in cell wall biosynthesis